MINASELVVNNNKVYHLGIGPEDITKNILLVGDPARADKISTFFDEVTFSGKNREFVTHSGIYKKMPITVIATGIGTDNTEIALMELYELNNFNLLTREQKQGQKLNIIRIGTCGTPLPEVELGSQAISEYAVGLDSTGLFYNSKVSDSIAEEIEKQTYELISENMTGRFKGKINPYASKATPLVFETLKKNASNCVSGITLTSSGFFGPQGRQIPGIEITIPIQEKIAELNVYGKKVVNIEMETSLLFHLSNIMNYNCGSICTVIANRSKGTFLSDYSQYVEKSIQIALNTILFLNSSE